MDKDAEELCEQLGRLSRRAERVRFLAAHPELLHASVVRELGEAVRAAVRINIRQALDLAQAAVAIGRELRDKEALAIGLRAKANGFWFQGDCRAAVRIYRRAASLFEQCENQSELARTLSSSIQSLILLGEYQQALDAGHRARDIFTALGDEQRVARLELNLANVYHRQNHFVEALDAYRRAYRQLLPYHDIEAIGVALHNMAVCLIALDNFHDACQIYEQARELYAREDMPLLRAQADYNVALLYYLRGDYTAALELLRNTREIYRRNGDDYHISLCDLDQSEIYLELSLIEEAAAMARSSLEQFEKLGMNYEQARALINLAVALHRSGDSAQALDLFARARDVSAKEENAVLPRVIDLYRALVFLELDNTEAARRLCEPAVDFFRSIPMPSKYVFSKLLLARTALCEDRLDEARDNCEAALAALAAFDAPILFYKAQFQRGQIFEAAGNAGGAYDHYQLARQALETLRSSLQRQELKIGFMRNRLDVYTRLTALCLAPASGRSPEEAFSYVEAAKCRTLRDLVLSTAVPDSRESRQTVAETRVRELRRELNWYYHRLEREPLSAEGAGPHRQDALTKAARAREHELSRILLEMPGDAGVGAALRDSSAASLSQIREKLGPSAALLEYFALGEQTYAALITSSDLKILPLAENAAIARSVRMLQFQLSKFRLDPTYTTQFRDSLLRATQGHLRSLYDKLIAPFESQLNMRDLVIVPFGLLHSLPFHALHDGRQYLIDRFSICYEPSASIFHHCHRETSALEGSSLILGIEDPKLPFVKQELDAVASAVKDAHLLYGAAATEDSLREHGRRSRIIHIATHGTFRQDNPLFSSIRLADSHLTLYDLYRMDLPVDLLTLSGCVTGLNVVTEGDELLGLTRGLLYAGARSLLLSLWEVEDRSTAEFMRELYCGLAQGRRKSDAVRAAMVALRERYPHPYFWAPFKLTGHALTL